MAILTIVTSSEEQGEYWPELIGERVDRLLQMPKR